MRCTNCFASPSLWMLRFLTYSTVYSVFISSIVDLNSKFLFIYFSVDVYRKVFNSYKNKNENKAKPSSATTNVIITNQFRFIHSCYMDKRLKTILNVWWTILGVIWALSTRNLTFHVSGFIFFSWAFVSMLMKLNGQQKCQTASVSFFLVCATFSSSLLICCCAGESVSVSVSMRVYAIG